MALPKISTNEPSGLEALTRDASGTFDFSGASQRAMLDKIGELENIGKISMEKSLELQEAVIQGEEITKEEHGEKLDELIALQEQSVKEAKKSTAVQENAERRKNSPFFSDAPDFKDVIEQMEDTARKVQTSTVQALDRVSDFATRGIATFLGPEFAQGFDLLAKGLSSAVGLAAGAAGFVFSGRKLAKERKQDQGLEKETQREETNRIAKVQEREAQELARVERTEERDSVQRTNQTVERVDVSQPIARATELENPNVVRASQIPSNETTVVRMAEDSSPSLVERSTNNIEEETEIEKSREKREDLLEEIAENTRIEKEEAEGGLLNWLKDQVLAIGLILKGSFIKLGAMIKNPKLLFAKIFEGFKGLGNRFMTFFRGIPKILTKAVLAKTTLIAGIFLSLFDGIADGILTALQGGSIVESLNRILSTFGDTMIQLITLGAADLEDAVNLTVDLAMVIRNGLTRVFETIGSFFGNIKTQIMEFDYVGFISSAFTTAFSAIRDVMIDIGTRGFSAVLEDFLYEFRIVVAKFKNKFLPFAEKTEEEIEILEREQERRNRENAISKANERIQELQEEIQSGVVERTFLPDKKLDEEEIELRRRQLRTLEQERAELIELRSVERAEQAVSEIQNPEPEIIEIDVLTQRQEIEKKSQMSDNLVEATGALKVQEMRGTAAATVNAMNQNNVTVDQRQDIRLGGMPSTQNTNPAALRNYSSVGV